MTNVGTFPTEIMLHVLFSDESPISQHRRCNNILNVWQSVWKIECCIT